MMLLGSTSVQAQTGGEPPPGAPPAMPPAETPSTMPPPNMGSAGPGGSVSGYPNEAVGPPAGHSAGPKVGGHIGVATPLVTIADETTTIGDAFVLAVPIGISVKVSDRLVIDFETIVQTPVDPLGTTSFVVDPGIVYNWGPVATGLRAAFQINQRSNFGLIPLINRGLVDFGGGTWFIEAAFPTFVVDGDFSFTTVLHTGIGF